MNRPVSGLRPSTEPAASDPLPVAGLLALATTGFIAILTETLPAGLLPQIAGELGVSETLAGQLVTLYALGSLLAAIPLVAATGGWPRRTVLSLAIGGFALFNMVTTLSSSYPLTLASRFLAGVAAGLAWGLLAGYARRMVAAPSQGRALAVAMTGTPVALSLGVPLGTLLGNLVGWRTVFGFASVAALLLLVWVQRVVPDFPGGAAGQRPSVRRVFRTPGVRPVLLVILTWMLAHNLLYTYIAPFLVPSGLAERVDLVLLVFGATALLGIWLTGLLIDRFLRPLVLGSMAAFALTALALGVGAAFPAVVLAGVAVWGVTFGGAATLLQTASADAVTGGVTGDVVTGGVVTGDVDLVQALVTTAWNLAIAGGGLLGGVLLERAGVGTFPWVLAALLAVGLAVAWRADAHGFRSGRTAPAAHP